MKRGRRLGVRLLLAHLLVIAIGSLTLFLTVGLVAQGTFNAAMGHAVSGVGGMDHMMSDLVQTAFRDAVQTSLVIAVLAASVTAIAVSVALSARLSRPIGRLAEATRRIAAGRYAERVRATSDDEIGELADSFNTMAASLEATERRRLELVGDVAHELRTPLATLDGYLEGLEDGVIKPHQATWTLLRQETTRLSRLVNDLQELWRAEARQLPLVLVRVDVKAALMAVREQFATPAQDHGIKLRLDVPAMPLFVRADPDRLAQIIDNFVSNAIRYSPAGASVTLSAAMEGDEVTVDVTDEGPGLTEEQQRRVFERFYRIDPSRSRALGGSGIGLAIAKALAEMMGGRAWVESEGPGRGATFRLALPRA